MIRVVFLIVSLIAAPVAAQESPPPATKDSQQPQFSENVEVVAVTPIHGLGVPKSKVAANVQVIVPPAVPALAPSDTARLLAERATSVTVTDSQAGTFQPDMLFRGFTGSPLLGSSEGLAVYQDGVRMNEAFGDTVSWDAIPATAIASLNLIPGSNPLFGLNALGGALSIRTKDGFSAPGSRGSFRGGSFGRYDAEAESGGQNGRLGYYLAGSLNTEDGWRDHSPSTVRRLFGDVGWRSWGSQFNVSFTGASNDLTGNGPSPEPLLAQDRAAVFTYPDRTDNDVAMAAARFLSSRSYGHVDGVAYYRYTALRTFNGDWAGDEAEGDFDAINNHSYTRSDAFGATGQLSRGTPLAGRDNHFVVGAGLDSASHQTAAPSAAACSTKTTPSICTAVRPRGACSRPTSGPPLHGWPSPVRRGSTGPPSACATRSATTLLGITRSAVSTRGRVSRSRRRRESTCTRAIRSRRACRRPSS